MPCARSTTSASGSCSTTSGPATRRFRTSGGLPLDTIKIDRSFVAGIDDDNSNLPIVKAVIALAHGLGIEVVAEGIENECQLERLRELVCDRGQGYWFARPQPPEALTALLAGGVAPAV